MFDTDNTVAEAAPQPVVPVLTLSYDHSINYAFQQNAIPVVKELHFKNDATPRKDLVIRVSTEPAFAAPVEIRLQGIDAEGEFRVAPLDLKLSHDFLAGLNERVSGWLKAEVIDGETVMVSVTEPISLLARNEWCGLVALPEILAAFILPNDPAVMTILGRASELLRESTGRDALNGYQDKSRKRAWEQVAAIYKAISGLGIRYINPPASFENSGQKVRFPSDIISQQFGTCLDLALLVAACCEQAGLRPFVFIHDGHAYSGCWLEEGSLPEPAGDDLQHIRKLSTDSLITVFETTILTDESPGTLNDAELLARAHLLTEKPFRLALDVHGSRNARIRPLPIPGQSSAANNGGPGSTRPVSQETGIGNREFVEHLDVPTAGPTTPATRIDQWKSRLLDLSLRNRLLNFRETKSTIRILSAEPERVEDELAAERELALRPKPKLMSDEDPRNAITYTKEQRADALADHLRDELGHGRLHTHLDEPENGRRLTELFRAARNALDENGTNTLYAAVGILEWRETDYSDRVHRAPLLLVPVELKRKSVLEGFSLKRIDEETRLNFTLMEMLRQNFRKEIPGLDPLPEDENGVNVTRVLQIFRDAVRDLAGWEVKTEVWLGQFSFTKFLLWKDLADRIEDLTKNRIVRHLIHDAGSPYSNPSEDIRPPQLDDQFHPRDIFCPRSADSSQLAAVMAAAAGHDFVLEGPPGTGKSQTITNIIAHCLAHGKRVLFVAEKRAALDVVHRRLREEGLEPFCLELHSNKTGKADVLAQFDKSLKFIDETEDTDWEMRASEMERLRTRLNTYTRSLHRRLPCGLSAHHCLDYLLPRKDEPTVRLDAWKSLIDTPAETLEETRLLARRMQERSRPLVPLADHPLAALACDEWSPMWAEKSLERVHELGDLTRKALAATQDLRTWINASGTASKMDLANLDLLAESLLSPEPVGSAFATTPWNQLSADIEGWIALARERTQLRQSLAPLHKPQAEGAISMPCEAWTPGEADDIFKRSRELEILLKTAADSTAELYCWLHPSRTVAPRAELVRLVALVDSLLAPEPVGASFSTAPWAETAVRLDRWIALAGERVTLRAKITGYDEAKLVALDLETLNNKWELAQNAWFLPKALNLSNIRKNLLSARPDGIKPDAAKMGGILKTTLRIRAINAELATASANANALLGSSWNTGEPDARTLERIRLWGETLHDRIDSVSGDDLAWRSHLQTLLTGIFRDGPASFAPGTVIGNRLVTYRDGVSNFDHARESLVSAAALNPIPLDEAADHYTAVGTMLGQFLQSALRLRAVNAEFSLGATTAQACLGVLWAKGEPAPEAMSKAFEWGKPLHARMLACAGDDLVWLGQLRQLLSGLFTEGPEAYAAGASIGNRLLHYREMQRAFNTTLDEFSAHLRLRREGVDTSADHLSAVIALTERIITGWDKIRDWCSWQKARHEGMELGLAPAIDKLESPDGHTLDLPALLERSFRRALLFAITEGEPALRDFFGREHNERIERFRELDTKLAKLSRDIIRARLAAGIPRDQGFDEIPKAEIGLLRKEISKRMRHIPVRQLIGRIPTLLPRLKPCVLMSPLSVAQYLEASHETFDLVIFDEASQIPVWDAIGAIARGKQLIVVGDPKQLPPTNFFSSGSDDEDDRTPEEHKDLESILDELMTNGLRHKRLQWHYRSRHEGLITFSNRQYYDNELLTFPSPETVHGGVRFRHLPEARYDKGKSRTNLGEAKALVHELVSRLRAEKGPRRSYGVVTFSQAQQQLVENLLDEERRKYPEIENHFGDEPPVEGESVFVKNLENVQGDERDVILFSICYGMDEAGKLSMNFGPLNRDGGERRLNVAVTRAKHEVLVFSGLRGDQIDLTRTRSRGVRDLKFFLDFAERGPRALMAATNSSATADPDSEFERMVADRIRAAGFDVHHQVGCSGYRIDLAVVDPTAPGRYLLGVECDGATYHRAATARDRDKLRQMILEDLGWKLHRIWSTDWWHDSKGQMEKLLTTIAELHAGRETQERAKEHVEAEACATAEITSNTEPNPENLMLAAVSLTFTSVAGVYQVTDFSGFHAIIYPDRFYDHGYDATLTDLIAHVLATEAPISEELLVRRIARAHGFQQAGRLIRERVKALAERSHHLEEDPLGGRFAWMNKDQVSGWDQYRTPHSEEETRKIEEISYQEIRAASLVVAGSDGPVEIGRLFGNKRLSAANRQRLQAMIDLQREWSPQSSGSCISSNLDSDNSKVLHNP
jgi:very-short-patch-repair endonuclease